MNFSIAVFANGKNPKLNIEYKPVAPNHLSMVRPLCDKLVQLSKKDDWYDENQSVLAANNPMASAIDLDVLCELSYMFCFTPNQDMEHSDTVGISEGRLYFTFAPGVNRSTVYTAILEEFKLSILCDIRDGKGPLFLSIIQLDRLKYFAWRVEQEGYSVRPSDAALNILPSSAGGTPPFKSAATQDIISSLAEDPEKEFADSLSEAGFEVHFDMKIPELPQ